MISSGSYLDLYCENTKAPWHEEGEFPHKYTAAFVSTCRKQARADGWGLFLKEDKAYCPKCMTIELDPEEFPGARPRKRREGNKGDAYWAAIEAGGK